MLFSRSENSEFKERRRRSRPIAEHPYFVPSLMLWGAVLLGLIVMVLPSTLINQVTTVAALGALGDYARLFYAVLAAGFGAGCGYFAATKWRDSLPVRSQAMMNRRADDLRPIDPMQDLGSDSLDAPLDDEAEIDEVESDQSEDDVFDLTVECEAEADEIGIDDEDGDILDLTMECEAEADDPYAEENILELGADCEADPEPDFESAHEPVSQDPLRDENCEPAPERAEPASLLSIPRRRNQEEPVELVRALGQHRARHAALHHEKVGTDARTGTNTNSYASRTSSETREFTHTPTAIDKLRAVPPQELSLVQMVERLAVALHERRDLARNRPVADEINERDAALAEALKALTMFTESGLHNPTKAEPRKVQDSTENELRDALEKLQTLQGAA